MNIYPVDLNTMLVAVCFNGEKPNLFMAQVNVILVDLKDQINRRLNHRDTRRVDGIGHQCPSIDSSGLCSRMMMMWEACSQYMVNATCSRRSSWMFRCWDLLKIFSKVWFRQMKIRLYYYVVSLFCWILVQFLLVCWRCLHWSVLYLA